MQKQLLLKEGKYEEKEKQKIKRNYPREVWGEALWRGESLLLCQEPQVGLGILRRGLLSPLHVSAYGSLTFSPLHFLVAKPDVSPHAIFLFLDGQDNSNDFSKPFPEPHALALAFCHPGLCNKNFWADMVTGTQSSLVSSVKALYVSLIKLACICFLNLLSFNKIFSCIYTD